MKGSIKLDIIQRNSEIEKVAFHLVRGALFSSWYVNTKTRCQVHERVTLTRIGTSYGFVKWNFMQSCFKAQFTGQTCGGEGSLGDPRSLLGSAALVSGCFFGIFRTCLVSESSAYFTSSGRSWPSSTFPFNPWMAAVASRTQKNRTSPTPSAGNESQPADFRTVRKMGERRIVSYVGGFPGCLAN